MDFVTTSCRNREGLGHRSADPWPSHGAFPHPRKRQEQPKARALLCYIPRPVGEWQEQPKALAFLCYSPWSRAIVGKSNYEFDHDAIYAISALVAVHSVRPDLSEPRFRSWA